MQRHGQIAAEFLRTVFEGQEGGVIALFSKPSKRSKFISLANRDWSDEAAKYALAERRREDVYFAIGVQGQQPHKGRGKQADVLALPGLWADIDVRGPNHAATNLPPTIEDAWSVLNYRSSPRSSSTLVVVSRHTGFFESRGRW
jgi:hypothetical protein